MSPQRMHKKGRLACQTIPQVYAKNDQEEQSELKFTIIYLHAASASHCHSNRLVKSWMMIIVLIMVAKCDC